MGGIGSVTTLNRTTVNLPYSPAAVTSVTQRTEIKKQPRAVSDVQLPR